MQKYGKFVLALLLLVGTAIVTASTGGISPVEWAQVGVAATGAAGVYLVPITVDFPAVKTVVGFGALVATTLVGLLGDGWSIADFSLLLAAVAGFFGIAVAPAQSTKVGVPLGFGPSFAVNRVRTRPGPAPY